MSCTFSELSISADRRRSSEVEPRDGARQAGLLYGALPAMSASPAIRILSIEDHPVFFEGLRLILESQEDMVLVGHSMTVAGAIDQFGGAQPDIVLLDLRLPDVRGSEGVLVVRKQFPEARVIVLTTVDHDGD